MKIRLCAMLLVWALLLSGCTSMLQRTYSSSSDHVDYTVEEDSSVLRAESYRGLVDAILYFVNEHLAQGVVHLYNYTGDVEADLAAACREVVTEDPLSAYAVDEITYEYTRIVSYYEVTVSVSFAHTESEILAIQPVSGTSAIRPLLDEAMAGFSSGLTLRVSYFSGDEETLHAMAAQAYYANPLSAFGMPELDVALYPDSGPQRIVKLTFQWAGDKKTLEMRSAELLNAAQQFLSEHPAEDGAHTPATLGEAYRPLALSADPAGAADPYSALTGTPSSGLAHTLALSLLFSLSSLDATLVTGFCGGEDCAWLIVDADEGYRHLFFTEEAPLLCTDSEMTELGYLWLADQYPACEDGSPGERDPGESAAPEDAS